MYKIIGADGKEYGPVSLDQLRQWISEGRLNQQSKVLPEGNTEWKTVAEVPELAGIVPTPAAVQPGPFAGATPDIPNYLWQSIAVTLCCCLPFGVVAIVFAAQVKSKLSVGDIAGAQDSSKKARMWCWIGFGVGIVVNLVAATIQFLAMSAAAAGGGRGF
jgi:hypothetical protein